MAEPGLTYYDSRNKVESNLLQTQYQDEIIQFYGTSQIHPIMKYTRTRTKTYSFVGLSKTAAKKCVNDKMKQYTRTFYTWTQQPGGTFIQNKNEKGSYTQQVATVQAQNAGGQLWNVSIQINEQAVIYTLGRSLNLEASFDYYVGAWDYDED